MARIAPLRGLRYNQDKIAALEDVVSPPYDVIGPNAQKALLHKNPYNMIHLDLTKSLASESLTDERYEKVKQTFADWQRQGVLIRDANPALYLYYTDYSMPSGRKFTRKGLIALAGLAEFSEGVVKPHEKTFSRVTSDRLRLLDTCQAQFSPIFSLYSDPEGLILRGLEAARESEPLAEVNDPDGCCHRIWAVRNSAAIAAARAMFVDRDLYIADGHHRYSTALQLRTLMRRRGEEVAADNPCDYTMMYLCGMEDEGLSILPTHRLVQIPYVITVDEIVTKMRGYFEVTELGGGSREMLLEQVLARMDENRAETMLGFYHPAVDRCFLLKLKPGVMAETCSGKHPAALQDLDVVVLAELLLECVLGLTHEMCERDNLIAYYPDPDEALDAAVKGGESGENDSPVLFLMNPTLVSQVRRIADEGLVMPHKSTYFYPKLLTGLLINQIHADEKVAG